MTWFHDDFFWLPANPDKFDSHIYLKVDDGHRIWLEMGDCTSPDTYHSDCPCGRGEEMAEEHFRELSLDELKELRSACDKAVSLVLEGDARYFRIKHEGTKLNLQQEILLLLDRYGGKVDNDDLIQVLKFLHPDLSTFDCNSALLPLMSTGQLDIKSGQVIKQ